MTEGERMAHRAVLITNEERWCAGCVGYVNKHWDDGVTATVGPLRSFYGTEEFEYLDGHIVPEGEVEKA